LRVNYVEVVNRETMRPETEVLAGRSLLAVAVWVDQVRLIDNLSF
jgi:pantoate--beta-alanine ligase